MIISSNKIAWIGLVALLLVGCGSAIDKSGQYASQYDGTSPTSDKIIKPLLQAAMNSQDNADYMAAASRFRKLYQKRPDDRFIILGLSRNLRYSGAAKEAVNFMQASRAKFSADSEFLAELGKALLASGKTGDSISLFKAAAEIDPGNWQIYSALGIAYDLKKQYGKAKKSYLRALELSNDNPVVLNNMAMSAAQTGNITSAIKTLNKASFIDRHNPQIRQNLALLYGISGNIKNAESLARMDLDEEAVRNNLDFYHRFSNKDRPQPDK